MIGVKNGQFIQGGSKVRLDEMGVGDRRFSVDHEIVSKEIYECKEQAWEV